MKLLYMCLVHSLFSAYGKIAPIAFSNPLQASLHITSPGGSPMTLCKFSRNHFQLSLVSEWNTPNAIWYNQLCPSTPVAEANYPVYFPFRKDASTPTKGLQPARNPSMHGFKATKTLLNLYFLPIFSNSMSTWLPGELCFSWAAQLKRSWKLSSYVPWTLSKATFNLD